MTEHREGSGLIPVGSLTSKIADTLTVSDSPTATSEPCAPISSRGSLTAPEDRKLGLGGAHPKVPGAIGVGARRNETAINNLALVASWPPPVQSWIGSAAILSYDDDYNLSGVRWPDHVPLTPTGQKLAAAALVSTRKALEPADDTEIIMSLARLRVSCASRNLDADDMQATLGVYADELANYPADVIRDACKRMGREKWFPALGEVLAVCDRLVLWRRRAAQQLEAMAG